MSQYEHKITREIIKPIIDKLLEEERLASLVGFEVKKTKAIQKQKLEDDGFARAIRQPERIRGIDVHKAQMAAVVEIDKTKDKQTASNKIARAVVEAKKALIEKVKAVEIKQQVAIAAADEATELIEEAVLSVDDIIDNHADWIDAYEEKSGKKAIWKGRITEGFKDFIELNGFK